MKNVLLISFFVLCSCLYLLPKESSAFFGYGRTVRANFALAGDPQPHYATCCKSSFAMDCDRSVGPCQTDQ